MCVIGTCIGCLVIVVVCYSVALLDMFLYCYWLFMLGAGVEVAINIVVNWWRVCVIDMVCYCLWCARGVLWRACCVVPCWLVVVARGIVLCCVECVVVWCVCGGRGVVGAVVCRGVLRCARVLFARSGRAAVPGATMTRHAGVALVAPSFGM